MDDIKNVELLEKAIRTYTHISKINDDDGSHFGFIHYKIPREIEEQFESEYSNKAKYDKTRKQYVADCIKNMLARSK